MPTINAWNSNVPVEIAKGGTNATSMTNSGAGGAGGDGRVLIIEYF